MSMSLSDWKEYAIKDLNSRFEVKSYALDQGNLSDFDRKMALDYLIGYMVIK